MYLGVSGEIKRVIKCPIMTSKLDAEMKTYIKDLIGPVPISNQDLENILIDVFDTDRKEIQNLIKFTDFFQQFIEKPVQNMKEKIEKLTLQIKLMTKTATLTTTTNTTTSATTTGVPTTFSDSPIRHFMKTNESYKCGASPIKSESLTMDEIEENQMYVVTKEKMILIDSGLDIDIAYGLKGKKIIVKTKNDKDNNVVIICEQTETTVPISILRKVAKKKFKQLTNTKLNSDLIEKIDKIPKKKLKELVQLCLETSPLIISQILYENVNHARTYTPGWLHENNLIHFPEEKCRQLYELIGTNQEEITKLITKFYEISGHFNKSAKHLANCDVIDFFQNGIPSEEKFTKFIFKNKKIFFHFWAEIATWIYDQYF